MLGCSECRVPRILSQVTHKPNKMNSHFYLNKAKACFNEKNFPEAFENFVNYFESLDNPGSSPSSIQVAFTKLVCRIGLVLEENNDTEELLKVYLQALNFFPNNYIILNNLGAYLFRMGEIDIARRYLTVAVTHGKDYLPAEKNLMYCKWHQIPRWHFKMLNDTRRNVGYFTAISKIMNEGYKNVLDIGAGCGLLTLMAAQTPESTVTAIEENKVISKICDSILKENLKVKVDVMNVNSMKLTAPPAPCNLLVTEIFDVALFGEKMLETLIHACETLVTVKDKYKMVPCGAKLYATAINYRSIQSYRVINAPEQLHMQGMCIRQIDADPYEAEDLTRKCVDYLSEATEVFAMNFYNVDQLNAMIKGDTIHVFTVKILADGTLTSLAIWFELYLDDDTVITTDPRNANRVQCWEQAVFHLPHPVDVRKGENISFEVIVSNNQLKFIQLTKPVTCDHCWLVSEEIVSFLNDTKFLKEIFKLVDTIDSYECVKQYLDPQKPILDLMCFPLFGFLMASKFDLQFCSVVKVDCEFEFMEFFRHILEINSIAEEKMIISQNGSGTNTTMCGLHKYLKECKLCFLNPIATDGSLHPTICLKDKIKSLGTNTLTMPVNIIVKVSLIYSDDLQKWNFIQDANVFNFKISKFMNEYSGTEHPNLEELSYDKFSDTVGFIVDDQSNFKESQNLLVTKTGIVNGLYTWFDIKYYGNSILSTIDTSHIRKSCYLLQPRKVTLGDMYRIQMRREGTYLSFDLGEQVA